MDRMERQVQLVLQVLQEHPVYLESLGEMV